MSVYENLQEILHKNPAGAPKSDSFDKILRILFSPEQAEIATLMSFIPKNIDVIAEKAGMSVEDASALCESMANKGIIFSREKGGQMGYSLLPTVPGVFEFPFMAGGGTPEHKKLGKLWEEYHLDGQSKEFASSPTPFTRIVPVEETLSSGGEVLPYETLSTMMENNKTFALAHCACRVAADDKSCGKSTEVCLIFDRPAEFLIQRKLAKPITREQAIDVLKKSEEEGLVHTSNNSQDRLNFVCNCCPCCCTILTGLTKVNAPHPFAKGRWYATIDESLCTACGTCRDERCPVEAIAIDDGIAVADRDKCIGCGVCASACPEEAISMKERKEFVAPPNTMIEMGAQILMEKGRLEEFMELNKS